MANGKYSFGKSSSKRLEGVDPRMSEIMTEAIKTSPYDFGIAQGKRSYEEQFNLYKKGRQWNPKSGIESDPSSWEVGGKDKIVTKTMKSKHLAGRAIDVSVFKGGKYVKGDTTEEMQMYRDVGAHIKSTAKRLGYEKDFSWGGDWKKFVDAPHYEIKQKPEDMFMTSALKQEQGIMGPPSPTKRGI